MSCQLPIDLDKYEQLCHKTEILIIDKLPWLPMAGTVGKILVHSTHLVEKTVPSVGSFGEEAA